MIDYDKNNVWHVLPINDALEHRESVECECKPKLELQDNDGLVVVHNAYDGRELEENGKKAN